MHLRTPEERKGKLRLFYRFRNPCGNAGDSRSISAKTTDHPKQELPITKKTPTKEVDSKKGSSYRFTEHDIQQFGKELNQAGSIEQLLKEKEAIKTKNGEREIVILENGTGYRETFLSEYSLPGLNAKKLRTPYTLWMTLYHHYQNRMKWVSE